MWLRLGAFYRIYLCIRYTYTNLYNTVPGQCQTDRNEESSLWSTERRSPVKTLELWNINWNKRCYQHLTSGNLILDDGSHAPMRMNMKKRVCIKRISFEKSGTNRGGLTTDDWRWCLCIINVNTIFKTSSIHIEYLFIFNLFFVRNFLHSVIVPWSYLLLMFANVKKTLHLNRFLILA